MQMQTQPLVTTGSMTRRHQRRLSLKVGMDQVSAPTQNDSALVHNIHPPMQSINAPVQPVSTQHSNEYWSTSQSAANSQTSAMSISFVAPLSNRVNEIQPAAQFQPPAQFQPTDDLHRPTQSHSAALPQLHARHAQTPPWTSENDNVKPQSYIPQPEASPRFLPSISHSLTVPPAQVPSSRLSFDSEAFTSRSTAEKHLTQSESEGGVTPWQQRGADDCRYDYNDDQIVTLQSSGYGDFNRGLIHGRRFVEPPALSGDQHRDGGFSGGATYSGFPHQLQSLAIGSEAPTSNGSYSKESSSLQTRKRRSESQRLHSGKTLGEPLLQWGNDPSDARSQTLAILKSCSLRTRNFNQRGPIGFPELCK